MGRRETLAAVREKYPQYADMTDDQLGAALAAKFPEYADLAPAPERTGMLASSPKDLIARGITGSGFGMQTYATPAMRVAPAATVARVAPGLVPNPLIAGPASAAGEAVAQAAEQGVGAREGFDPVSIGVAGALPPVVAGAARVVRGLGRTVTRFVPSRFEAAHGRAFAGAEDVAEQMRPEARAVQLFKAARGTGETVPAGRITAILDDLDQTIPQDPANAGLQQVRAFADKLRAKIQGGAISLDDLLQQRLDLGREIQRRGSAPELRALYGHGGDGAKGIIGALEEAAEVGGPGAANARAALEAFKSDRGIATWRELVADATTTSTVSGAGVPVLNMAKLGRFVRENEAQLRAQLGDDGMTLVREFQRRFASLPPAQAYTAANTTVSVVLGLAGGAAGFVTGLPGLGLAAGLAGRELVLNAKLVGRNPELLNQVLTGVAQTARAGGSVRVGPEAQDLARERRGMLR